MKVLELTLVAIVSHCAGIRSNQSYIEQIMFRQFSGSGFGKAASYRGWRIAALDLKVSELALQISDLWKSDTSSAPFRL